MRRWLGQVGGEPETKHSPPTHLEGSHQPMQIIRKYPPELDDLRTRLNELLDYSYRMEAFALQDAAGFDSASLARLRLGYERHRQTIIGELVKLEMHVLIYAVMDKNEFLNLEPLLLAPIPLPPEARP